MTTDAAVAAASTYGGESGGPQARPVGEMQKIVTPPGGNLALTGMGATVMALTWYHAPVDYAGIDRLLETGPGYLRAAAERWPGLELLAIAAGWSRAEGRVVVATFEGPSFEPARLPPCSASHPALDPAAEDHAALTEAGVAAADGIRTDEWYVNAARHQVRANQAGRLFPGVALGGELTLARIDANGAKLRTLSAF